MTTYANPPSPDTVSLATLERASGLWYLDGTIIICSGSLVFRVFRGMLAEQSPILEDLVSPENLGTYDVFDGCPVVPLPHGSSEVLYFLNAIFKPKCVPSFFMSMPSLDSLFKHFDPIAAIFRLSSLYKVPDLQRKALILLSSVYPMTLEEFSTQGLGPSYCRDQIMPVIQLARHYSLDWILPLAFYRFCLEMTHTTLVYGVEYAGSRIVLSTPDKARCFEADRLMRSSYRIQIRERCTRLNAGCDGNTECQESRLREASILLDQQESVSEVLFHWAPESSSRLCVLCLEEMERWHMERRQSFWDGLPGLFGLPGWTELNEMKDAARGR
ncbi:hypothetical protein DFH07DRAFT_753519 [Mycena maculata]|uniref:BTB domain-containing protein n=1 Tax=Mycena maculata TaxID=230809 RepID=A0AAD7MYH5_9AGAR|nr:hypothetical protein DFH07DRAFT_753519 [Mycena maculata]